MAKRETVEEFLARGGVIQKLAPVEETEEEKNKQPTTLPKTGVASMMSLSEGSLYYAEQKAKKIGKVKVAKTVDFSALPANLMKFIPSRND